MSPSGARNSTQLLVRTTTRVSAFTGTGAGTLGAAVTSGVGVGVDAGVDPSGHEDAARPRSGRPGVNAPRPFLGAKEPRNDHERREKRRHDESGYGNEDEAHQGER